MPRQTHYIDQLGIRVDGHTNKTEARKAWEAARDHWCDISTACPPWVFAWEGHTVMVCPTPHDTWCWTITRPDDCGRKNAQCYFRADSQYAAIADALGALAQAAWSPAIADDAVWFDSMVIEARCLEYEARNVRSNFLTVAAHWRATSNVEAA